MLELRQKIVRNTVEQSSLFVALSFMLVTYLTEAEMKIIPLIVMHHCIGRIIFAHGYDICLFYEFNLMTYI